MMGSENIHREIKDILDQLTNMMHEKDTSQILDFLKYEEYKIALETLCEYLAEDNIKTPSDLSQKIVTLCKQLNIKEIYWKGILEDYY